MKKKTGLVVIALLIISMVAAGAYAMGFGGKGLGMLSDNGAVISALKSGDYNAYTAAIESATKAKVPTQAQFNSLLEKYKQEAPTIEARQKAEQAIQNNDYTAWSAAMNALLDSQRAQINQQNFDSIVKMHQQMQGNNSTMIHKVRGFGRGHLGIGAKNDKEI